MSQYRTSLKMLINAIAQCPEELWDDQHYDSPYWQIVYHSLHFAAFYLSEDEASFTPWVNHRPGVHQLGILGISPANAVHGHYSKADLQNYIMQIIRSLEFKEQDLTASSGFEWLSMNKFELHLYNLRHLQHHIGQLVERLHGVGIKGIDWIGSAQ